MLPFATSKRASFHLRFFCVSARETCAYVLEASCVAHVVTLSRRSFVHLRISGMGTVAVVLISTLNETTNPKRTKNKSQP